ncbi:hypothetical protein OESDEN_21839 [Oesophagostomum dentatum]|uniref:Uncharacterized protein n=1 Tax=Oesophagostomum dentatum TaxID=61180 RepID=A0A0B1S0T4_OESDE|nr:hypothetical protein OESDEN_21839 [Oesophagostomum dentatum]
MNTTKRRETFWRQKASEKETEIKELTKERNAAYCGGISHGPSHRDQHIDPFFYEGFLAVKDKIASKEKEIADNQEIIKSLEANEDSEVLLKMLNSKRALATRIRAHEKTLKYVAKLESNLEMIRTALREIRQEKRDQITEIAERDAKIAELYKELSSLRGSFTDESTSNHSGDKESAKTELVDPLDEKPLFEEDGEGNGDVNVEEVGV